MRPIRLEMAGFGAYAGREVVDFAVLGPSALFLIHGPTGAGKTTILDAVCFALYGETSGGERDGRQMRSQHAGPDTPTEVVLDFALGEAAYRVRRNPDYERPRQRGGGVTQERHAATLWSLEPDGEAVGGWREKEVLATKATGVAEEVRRRLGLDAQQFRQVVVLPQGQFRKLLSASSDERERILAVLFATDRYEALQKLMRERALELEREAKDLRRREADLLAQAGAEDHETLDARLDGLRAEGAGAAERLETLKAGVQAARTAREAGQTVRARLDELAEAEADLARVEAEAPGLEEARGRCDRARAAAALAADQARSEEAERRARRTAESLADSAGKLAHAETASAEAAARLATERTRSAEREAARREAERLEALGPDVAGAYRAEAEANRLWREDVAATASVEGFAERLETANAAAAEAQAAAEEARAAENVLQSLESRARDQARNLENRRGLLYAEGELAQQELALDRTRSACARAEAEVEQQQRQVEATELAFRTTSAGALAQTLAAGEPCPVCGSLEHPSPAVAVANETAEAVLKLARERLDQKRREISNERINLARAEERREASTARVAQLKSALGSEAGIAIGRLEEAERTAREELARAKAKAGRLGEAEANLQAARTRADQVSRERDGLYATMHSARTAAVVARNNADEAVARLPDFLRGLAGAVVAETARQNAHAKAATRFAALERALAEAEAAARVAEGELATTRAGRDACAREAAEAAAEREGASATLAAAITRAGFADLDAYRAALLDPQDLDALDAELKAAGERRRSAADRAGRARAAAAGLTAPDLTSLGAAEAEAERAAHEATESLGALREHLEHLERLRRQARELAPKRAALEARYGALGRLADVATGNAGSYKITFQRFVLGALLDEVLDAASRRLGLMSQGRYTLRRLDPEASGGHKGRAAGLDLEVDDAWTGRSRHVATLSGGEGFLAALALALGLADVVQARAGGRRLDTLFVDEGFGALDADALDLALKVLTQLQRDGRLVGVISHVPELRERIDVRLEVLKGERGSSARFRLP